MLTMQDVIDAKEKRDLEIEKFIDHNIVRAIMTGEVDEKTKIGIHFLYDCSDEIRDRLIQRYKDNFPSWEITPEKNGLSIRGV